MTALAPAIQYTEERVRTGHTENLQRSGEMKTECFVLDMQMALGFITHLNQPAQNGGKVKLIRGSESPLFFLYMLLPV